MDSKAAVPNSFWYQELVSWKTIFPWTRKRGDGFRMITLIGHFISIFITSAPPQIIRHLISEIGDPWFKEQLLVGLINQYDAI